MAEREYFVGQRDPVGQIGPTTYEITNEPIKVSKTEIDNMSASQLKTRMQDPNFVKAMDAAYAPAPAPQETPTA